MACAVVLHSVGSAQLVVDAIGSEVVSDHTGGYLGTGVSFADFNGDGLDDLTFGHHDGALSFYAGNGDGFDSIDLGLGLPTAEAKGVLWADIDNDGDQDLFVAYRFAPNKLWLNDGEMGFEDVSSSCGIAQDNRRSFGPAFGDFDRDGLLDLFVANYGYAVDVPQGNELYRNVGGGQFEDVTAEFGLDGENLQSFQATWMDVDRDGWLDLHVIRDRLIFPNLFYHNKAEEQGAVGFEEEAQARGMDAMLNCMSSRPHDYDRDGDLDLFIAGGLEGNMLLVNNGDGYYTDATNDLVQMNEVCWSGQWLDVDAEDNIINVGVKEFTGDNPLDKHAITGTMFFKDKEVYLSSLSRLYENNTRTNGEFYIDNLLNEAIRLGYRVKNFEVDEYICWGTPNDLETYRYWQTFFNKVNWHPYDYNTDYFTN